ncbi:MAG: hypothetical protein KatS3mg113_0938 [Planctomycetaceae bacterium]|nr:MAG: hypothetical protein KatS3mg113_0938 [Planctomycetaceae bacterium]
MGGFELGLRETTHDARNHPTHTLIQWFFFVVQPRGMGHSQHPLGAVNVKKTQCTECRPIAVNHGAHP